MNAKQEKLVQIPCDLTKVETMSQGKLKLIFVSQEALPERLKQMAWANHEKFGWLAFLPGKRELDTLDVVTLPPLPEREKGEKSPSQQLRAVLYVLWEQQGKPTDTFEEYYRKQMERFVNAVKEKLT